MSKQSWTDSFEFGLDRQDSLGGYLEHDPAPLHSQWQGLMNARKTEDFFPGRGGSDRVAGLTIPRLEITGDCEKARDIVIASEKRGIKDTVAGINPRPGETLAELIKRLHPDLSDAQLAKEVQKVLKYNRDYGNDLGDGSRLDSGKAVFLTSVKYLDDRGRITRIEGPTGRITEISYDANGIFGYKITEADGRVAELAYKDAGGNWVSAKNGWTEPLKDVEIDIYGNITATDLQGNTTGHLTRGDDVHTRCGDGQLLEFVTVRNGQVLVVFEYEQVDGAVHLYARYSNDPERRVKISAIADGEQEKRLGLATGRGPQTSSHRHAVSAPASAASADIEPDEYVANRITRAAYREAKSRNTVGWCYAGVADALEKVGVNLHGASAYMAKDQLLRDQRFAAVSISDLRPGDVLVHGRSASHKHGHIAVYLGNGLEASDHVQSLIKGAGYGGTTVFRYIG